MKNLLLVLLVLFTTVSCNIYKFFDSTDILEAAYDCLHKGDYACAIAEYNKLADGELKYERLCMLYLSKSGIQSSTLITTMQETTDMFGTLANEVAPYTTTKETDTDNAKTQCGLYKTAVTGGANSNNGALLNAMASYVHCAMLMAKTDVSVCTGDGDAGAGTAGENDGIIEATDIATAIVPGIPDTTTYPAMCETDALACRTDVQSISADLTSAGLTGLINFPSGLDSASGASDAIIATAVRDILDAEFDGAR